MHGFPFFFRIYCWSMEYENVQGDGRFVQVKAQEDHRQFEILDIWTTLIEPRQAQTLVIKLKSLVDEVHPLNHLRKLNKEEGDQKIRLAICSVDSVSEISQVEAIMHKAGAEDVLIERRQCSRYPGRIKEQNTEWAQKSGWPMIWRGNVAAIPTKLPEAESAAQHLRHVVELSEQNVKEGQLPIACLIVNPITNQVVVEYKDQRLGKKNPLSHCIMEAVRRVADDELARRAKQELSEEERQYLCLDLHVYSTHEPCVMCAMALNHSRIAKLFYIQSRPKTGGIEPTSGGGHCVHWNSHLNWQYEAWRYISEEDPLVVGECGEAVNV